MQGEETHKSGMATVDRLRWGGGASHVAHDLRASVVGVGASAEQRKEVGTMASCGVARC